MSFSSTDPSPDLPESDPISAGHVAPTADQPTTGGVNLLRCEVCGAALAADQRYCVECGNHRVGVNDPAASFMNRSSARGAQRAGRAVVMAPRRNRLQTALALVLIPIAIGVGVLIGRSSNNQDHRLLRAISQERNRVVTVQSGTAKVVTVAGGGAATKQTSKAAKQTSRHVSRTAAHKASGSVGSTSSTSQAKQSAKIVKKLQSTNGLSYLNPLPSQVGG